MDIYKKKKRRFTRDFKKISKYLKEEKGVSVVLGETTEYTGPFNRQIIIHHNYDLRNNGLYVLLYEAGRVYLPIGNPEQYSTDELLANSVLREIKAWSLGKRIAKNLNIKINQTEWDENISRGIVSVIKTPKKVW